MQLGRRQERRCHQQLAEEGGRRRKTVSPAGPLDRDLDLIGGGGDERRIAAPGLEEERSEARPLDAAQVHGGDDLVGVDVGAVERGDLVLMVDCDTLVEAGAVARMTRAFDRWKRFDAGRQAKAKAQLERIRDAEGLSKDVAEIVTKALA